MKMHMRRCVQTKCQRAKGDFSESGCQQLQVVELEGTKSEAPGGIRWTSSDDVICMIALTHGQVDEHILTLHGR